MSNPRLILIPTGSRHHYEVWLDGYNIGRIAKLTDSVARFTRWLVFDSGAGPVLAKFAGTVEGKLGALRFLALRDLEIRQEDAYDQVAA